jgi:hypothetical protein
MNRIAKWGLLAALVAGFSVMPALTREAVGKPEAGDVWVLPPKEEGYSVAELLDLVGKETGSRFVYDRRTPTVKQDVFFLETQRVPREKVFVWLRSVLFFQRVVLLEVGPPEANLWSPRDENDPRTTSRPVYLEESEIERCREMIGVFCVATVRTKHLLDTSRARNALAQLCTPRIGRVNDVPGSRGFVIADYGPVVHAMWKLIKAMDVEDQVPLDPRTGRPVAPTPPAAAAPTRAQAIAKAEEMLARCQTTEAARYFVNRIEELRAEE